MDVATIDDITQPEEPVSVIGGQNKEAVTTNNRIVRLQWLQLQLTDGLEKAEEADALIEGILYIFTTTCPPPWTELIQLPMTTFYLNIPVSVVLPLNVQEKNK